MYIFLRTDSVQKRLRKEKIHQNRQRRQGLPITPLPVEEEVKPQESPSGGSQSGSEIGGSTSHILASEVNPEVSCDVMRVV